MLVHVDADADDQLVKQGQALLNQPHIDYGERAGSTVVAENKFFREFCG